MAGYCTFHWFAVISFIWFQCCLAGDLGYYVNVALGKPTEHTATKYSGHSAHAVDGNRDSVYGHGSCTHTPTQNGTYWLVDLLDSYPIHLIHITNRLTTYQRFTDFYIYVSEVDPRPIPKPDGTLMGELCLYYNGTLPKSGPHSLACDSGSIRGRFVYVWRPANGVLTICEFEVFMEKLLITGYSVMPGYKISNAPYLSVSMERYSKIDCARICLSTQEGGLSAVQLDKETKTCQCVRNNDEARIVRDTEWTLMNLVVNCYPNEGNYICPFSHNIPP